MSELVGHRDARQALQVARRSGQMHHAWLLTGERGVGKARFAQEAAAWLLSGGEGDGGFTASTRTSALLEAGSHPDFACLTRLVRDEKSGTMARNIAIDQIRGLQRLFATTPSLAPLRVIIIDSADDLERGAANALLKNLEEPPQNTVFFLISHAPMALLPTIRSRCRLLNFAPLSNAEVRTVLCTELPDSDPSEIDALVAIAEGAPGRAMGYAGLDIAAIDAALEAIFASGDPLNEQRLALAQSLTGKAAKPRYEAFLARVPHFLVNQAKRSAPAHMGAAVLSYERVRDIAGSALVKSLDPQMTVFTLCGEVAALGTLARDAA